MNNLKKFNYPKWDITVAPQGEYRKVDVIQTNEQTEISKCGDYSASLPEVSLFEVYFYVDDCEVCGLEEFVMGYELNDECSNAKELKITFRVPCDAKTNATEYELKNFFADDRKVDIMVIRVSRTGQYIAKKLFENCKVKSHSKELNDKGYNHFYIEGFNFAVGE